MNPLPGHTGRNSSLQREVGRLCTCPPHQAPLALQVVPLLASHIPVNREARKNAILHTGWHVHFYNHVSSNLLFPFMTSSTRIHIDAHTWQYLPSRPQPHPLPRGRPPVPLPAASTHISWLTQSHTARGAEVGLKARQCGLVISPLHTSSVSHYRQQRMQGISIKQVAAALGGAPGSCHLSGTCGHSLGRINPSLEISGIERSLEVALREDWQPDR